MSRKILLQNENGPCPLLAAANALLLRGVISLAPECNRNGVASTDDVVNMLANRALLASSSSSLGDRISASATSTTTTTKDDNQEDNSRSQHEYHLNEVLSLLPNLQHGMDVNPKFTSGPMGVEYTKNLAAFDMLGVELVHGWLLDKQDVEAVSVIGSKTYNEVIETVIIGNEAKEGMLTLEEQLREKEKERAELFQPATGDRNIEAGSRRQQSSDKGVDEDVVGVHGDGTENNKIGQRKSDDHKQISDNNPSSAKEEEIPPVNSNYTVEEDSSKPSFLPTSLEKEITEMRGRITDLSLQITRSEVANNFLTSSGHQLTYHGLEQLHNHVGSNTLCVFFRNNHFATLTKQDGVLYLLVTDLGYANVPEIVWEKLDNIDGNTEYVNEHFEKPPSRSELKPAAGPTIAPELLLAQRSQAESDYQLALAMSKGTVNPRRMDDDEGKLIEAAKELSLQTYHGDDNAEVNVASTPSDNAINTQVDSDHKIALAFQREQQQREHESLQLARQLQELENQRATATQRPTRRSQPLSASSNCTIS